QIFKKKEIAFLLLSQIKSKTKNEKIIYCAGPWGGINIMHRRKDRLCRYHQTASGVFRNERSGNRIYRQIGNFEVAAGFSSARIPTGGNGVSGKHGYHV